jgi:hypothetical protein
MLKNKIIGSLAIASLALVLAGCGKNANNQNGAPTGNGTGAESDAANKDSDAQSGNLSQLNTCKDEKVNLPNYGDPGKRLKNCFVQYPGEPSRQDKSYYIIEDICGQFTQQFMENMLGQKVEKIEPPKIASLHNCSYYLNEKEYLLINLEYLKIENQKLYYEQVGDKVEKSSKISTDNLMVMHGDNLSEIYLVLNPEKFISIRPNSKNTIGNDEFLNFAANLAGAIKGYK